MKTTVLLAIALGALTALALGPADRAVAEPFELTAEQMDTVTAGQNVTLIIMISKNTNTDRSDIVVPRTVPLANWEHVATVSPQVGPLDDLEIPLNGPELDGVDRAAVEHASQPFELTAEQMDTVTAGQNVTLIIMISNNTDTDRNDIVVPQEIPLANWEHVAGVSPQVGPINFEGHRSGWDVPLNGPELNGVEAGEEVAGANFNGLVLRAVELP